MLVSASFFDFFFENSLQNYKNLTKKLKTFIKGATKSPRKTIFVFATKIGEITTNILNCYFSN